MTERLGWILVALALSGCWTDRAKPESVLLVTIDTLRADRLGIYGGGVATPRIDSIARDGVLFRNAYAHSPLTLPSHSSILTGTLPTFHGVRDNGRYRLSGEMETVAEILKGAGYSTAAFVGAFPVDSRFGLAQGFDVYDESFSHPASRLALAERRASEVVSRARQWLAANGTGRTFTWVHLFDPHAPYEPPDPFPRSYDGEVAYVDSVLSDLFSAVGEDTLVVVTADHGEGLGEHGEKTHSLFVYDSTIRVPLLMRGPGVRPGTVVEAPVRSIDILPTILDLVGLGGACQDCEGESLVAALSGEDAQDRAAYAETYFPLLNLGWSELKSVRAGGFKLIDAPEPELYHVASDPGETTNVIADNPEKADELRAALRRLEESSRASDPATSAPEVDADTAAALRSLGYLSSSSPPASASRPDPKTRLALWEGIREAMGLVVRGEWDQAISELEVVLRDEPELLLARTYLAAAYFGRGRYSETARACGMILERAPGDYDATLLLGRSLLRLGRDEEAKNVLGRAAELDPASSDPWVELAQLHLRRSKEEAERFLVEARKRDEHSFGVLLLRGKLAALNGDPLGAENLFRSALDAAPFEDEPRVQLGNLLLSERRLEEARGLFEEGLRIRPRVAAFHLGLGHGFALGSNLDGAISAFEKALELEPNSTTVLNSLGFAQLEVGHTEKGLALLRRSLELEPNQPELRGLLQKK